MRFRDYTDVFKWLAQKDPSDTPPPIVVRDLRRRNVRAFAATLAQNTALWSLSMGDDEIGPALPGWRAGGVE